MKTGCLMSHYSTGHGHKPRGKGQREKTSTVQGALHKLTLKLEFNFYVI